MTTAIVWRIRRRRKPQASPSVRLNLTMPEGHQPGGRAPLPPIVRPLQSAGPWQAGGRRFQPGRSWLPFGKRSQPGGPWQSARRPSQPGGPLQSARRPSQPGGPQESGKRPSLVARPWQFGKRPSQPGRPWQSNKKTSQAGRSRYSSGLWQSGRGSLRSDRRPSNLDPRYQENEGVSGVSEEMSSMYSEAESDAIEQSSAYEASEVGSEISTSHV